MTATLPAMNNDPPNSASFQYSIGGGMVVVAMIGAVLALGNYWKERGGLALAIPVAIFPASIVIERALTSGTPRKRCSLKVMLSRLAILILLSAVPMCAAWIGIVDSMTWWSPTPYLMFLPIAYFQSWFVSWPYAMFAVPMVAFLTVSFPVSDAQNSRLQIRSLVVLFFATITSIDWFCESLPNAFNYQSTSYIVNSAIANLLMVLLLWTSWACFRRRFTTGRAIAWNVVLISWLYWLAFPWLGEYI